MKNLITTFLFFVITSFVIAQDSLDSELVAYYPFNGNANDLSGFGNNGSLKNGVSFDNDRWNYPNQAIRFNKSLSQYVDVQNSPSLQIDSAISFSFWTKRNTLDNGQDQVLNKGGDWPGGTCNYGLVFSEWTLVFIYNGGYYIVNSPGVPLDNEWHHYVVTALEGTTEIHFYVDGVEKTSMFGGGNPVINLYAESTSDLYISGVNYFSNNSVDELKIYNRILTPNEIESLYSNLIAYLPLNGNTIDVSGSDHDGTINGNASLLPDRFNTSDRAYTFPDQSSNISLANTTSMNLETGFTINTWVKYKNTYSVLVGKHICGYVNGFILGIDYDGQFQLWLGNSGWQTVRTNKTLNEDRWYMVTATYDGSSGSAKIYLDGQLENSGTLSYTNFSSYPISIGEVYQNNCSPANMSGAVDEVKIYNRALTDAEILDEYNNTYNDLVLFL
ncbi:MAG: LamG domain-containing protein, partial [Ignavibacterium sp.]|nr:LamG domain-containing protein [Ignavibacterium sp.]